MRLVHLDISGLQNAASESLDLAPLQLVLGPNASGKSTIRKAIELLCLGHVVGGPKTNQGVMRLASGDDLTIKGIWDGAKKADAWWGARAWVRDTSGSVSCSIEASGAKGPKAADVAISSRLGPVGYVLALGDWLAESGDKRRRMLFDVAGEAGKLGGFEFNAVRLTAEKVADGQISLPSHRGHSLDTWISAVLDLAAGEGRGLKRQLKELEAVLVNAEQEISALPPTPDDQAIHLARLLERRDELQALGADAAKRVELRRRRDGLIDRRSALEGRLLEIPTLAPQEIARRRQVLEQLDGEVNQHDRDLALLAGQLHDAEHRLTLAVVASEAAKRGLEAFRDGTCPTCGQPAHSHVDVLQARAFEAEDEAETATESQAHLASAHEGLTERLDHVERQRDHARDELRAIEQNAKRSADADVMRTEALALNREADELTDLLAQSKDVDGLADEVRSVERELAVIAESAGQRKSLLKKVDRYRDEFSGLRVRLDVCESLKTTLGPKGIQGKIAEAVITPLVASADRLTRAAGLGHLSVTLEDAHGNPVLEPTLGAIPVDCLSGSELAVVHAALAMGWGDMAGTHWRPLIVDSIETLDRNRRGAFLRAIQGLVDEGHVDQALVLGCPDSLDAPEGWAVMELA